MIARYATADDEKQIIALYGLFVQSPDRYQNNQGHSFREFLANENNTLLVVEAAGTIVGFVSCSKRVVVRYPKPICEIEELYVIDAYRNQGVATVLIETVCELCEGNCQYVFVASGNQWEGAHVLYEKCGFDKYGLHFRKKL